MKETKFYNVLFPLWLLIIMPITWIAVIPANFIIDSIVLLLGIWVTKAGNVWQNYKKSILWVWLFGFASDIIGSLLLLLTQVVGFGDAFDEYICVPVSSNPFDNVWSMLFVIFVVIVSGLLIYVFNFKISFKNAFNGEKAKKRVASILLAVLTAPYFLLVPTTTLYGNSVKNFTNHLISTNISSSEFYTSESDVDLFAPDESGNVNYEKNSLLYGVEQGINYSEKCKDIDFDRQYRIVYHESSGKDKTVYFMVDENSDVFFEYDGKYYSADESYSERISNSISEFFNPTQPEEEIEEDVEKTVENAESQVS